MAKGKNRRTATLLTRHTISGGFEKSRPPLSFSPGPARRAGGPPPRGFLWGFLRISKPVSAEIGAILLPPCQSDARSPLWQPIQRFNRVACRYLFRCLSASCFRRIRTAQSGQYLARLDFGVNAAPHTAHRFTLSRLWMISAYSDPSSGRTAARNHRHSNE